MSGQSLMNQGMISVGFLISLNSEMAMKSSEAAEKHFEERRLRSGDICSGDLRSPAANVGGQSPPLQRTGRSRSGSFSTAPSQSVSIGFISLGCAKNLVDSEIMAAKLMSAGLRLAPSPEKADVVIVNTCAFIREAKEESLEAVFDACDLKKRGRCRAVLVAGCLPQRYPIELPPALPEADAFIGLDEVERVGSIVQRLINGERAFAVISKTARAVIEPPPDRVIFTGAPFAYVKIAEGCHHHCRFCAIPRIRGRYRSRPINAIVAEAETLLTRGIRELNLISQDVTSYGRDLGGRADLPRLLKALGAIGGRFWIRLLYGHPAHVTPALLEVMGRVSQVCHYLDLPIQHSHPALLRAMGRPTIPGGLQRLFHRIRVALPDIALRTTCLVGFPGETEAQFSHLMAFLEEMRFDHVGVFTYSREEATPAAELPRQIAPRLAQRRRDRLMRLQQRVVFQKARERIGHTAEILIEKSDGRKQDTWTRLGGAWVGRSVGEAPEVDGVVFVQARDKTIVPGTFVTVRYTAAAGYDMKAVLIT